LNFAYGENPDKQDNYAQRPAILRTLLEPNTRPFRRQDGIPKHTLSPTCRFCYFSDVNFFVQRSELRDLYDNVAAGERISEADALRLFESKDLNALGAIADLARQKKVGNRASYIVNRYLNYSNYCILSCQFCSFARKKRDADGFELTIPQMVEKAREALKLGITELHIVGGLHPSLPFSYYVDMLKALSALNPGVRPSPGAATPTKTSAQASSDTTAKSTFAAPEDGRTPRLQLKCFTAIEILHLAWLAKKTVEQTLRELKDAGLESLTGGGAEIFRKEVRSAIAKGKESAEEYLDVHRTWHRLGGRSTCTMLFGHIESLADRVDHLRQLRALQDETKGFVGFVPLPYQPENNDIPVKTPPTGFDALRTIAVSRIYLDNFDHITAYWVGMGMKLAQVALSYGADDLHGTIIEEHIFHMAGATSPQLQTEAEMIKAIREAGRTPVQRNTFYEPIKVLADGAPSANEVEPPSGKSKMLKDNLATA
jgi:aminodeoxyfutalosine synthase